MLEYEFDLDLARALDFRLLLQLVVQLAFEVAHLLKRVGFAQAEFFWFAVWFYSLF